MRSIIKYLNEVHNSLEFPDVRQSKSFTCGASSVQAILYYYGIDIREEELIKKLNTDSSGTNIKDIKNLFTNYGFKIDSGRMSISDLKDYVDKKIPVLICIQAWKDNKKDSYTSYNNGHYVIVIGYDENNIIFEDPSLQDNNGYMPSEELDKRWHDQDENNVKLDHFGMAIYGKPPKYDSSQLPRS